MTARSRSFRSLRLGRLLVPGLALAALLFLPAPPLRAEEPSFAGHWEGEIVLPGNNGKLGLIVDLRAPEGSGPWKGTVDIPDQGAKDLELTDIVISGASARFAIGGVPGQPVFVGTWSGGKISGTFSQGDLALPFTLGREHTVDTDKPQDPKPPYPYKVEEVSYQNGAVKLAATLTTPQGSGPFPAVVLLTGSGSQDRDESVFGHHPFRVLADHLTRQGIAVLRADDRGVGGSTGDPEASTSADLAQDALAGVRFLQSRQGIDPKRIGLLGHSEGAIVAPLAASQSPDVAFLVLLAGTGVPGEEVVYRQLELISRADGVSEEKLAHQLASQKRIFQALRTMTPAEAEAEIHKVLTLDLQEVSPEELRAMGGLNEIIRKQTQAVTSPWFRYFLAFDPRTVLRKLKKPPVLALNGEKDLQVAADQNLPEIEKALREAGNKDVTAVKLPGLNHLFQPATTGSLAEYAASAVTIDPAVLERIAGWIRQRFVSVPGAPAHPVKK